MKRPVCPSALVSCFLVALPLSFGCAHRQAETAAPATSTPAATATSTAGGAAAAAKATKADMKYRSVYVEAFTVSPKGVAESEPKSYLEDAQKSCLGELAASGLFDNVKLSSGSEPKEGALIVRAEVTSLRIVSGAARFWVGAMAGNSDMVANVTLVDAATGAVVATQEVKGDSNAWAGGWTMGAMDRNLPTRMGAHVAEYVAFSARK